MQTFRTLLGVIALYAAGALLQLLHPLAQAAAYHHFADTRAFAHIPNAADVLSNVLLLVAGVVNLRWVADNAWKRPMLLPGMVVAGIGLILTAAGSAYYHWSPSDSTLVWDRLPITVVFAGILILLWSSATLRRATWLQTVIVTAASVGTVGYWVHFGSLWPYALLQFGGLGAIVYLVAARRVLGVEAWWRVIQWYALAKVFEMFDSQIWSLTAHYISGHSLKHLASGAAGLALFWLAKNSFYTAEARKPVFSPAGLATKCRGEGAQPNKKPPEYPEA